MKTPQQIKDEVEKEFKKEVYLLERKSYLSQKINSGIALSEEERKEFVLTPSSNIIQGEMKELKAKLSILTEYDKAMKEMILNMFKRFENPIIREEESILDYTIRKIKYELLSKIGDNSEVEK